jgi:DNA replication protein DnaC
MLNEQTISTMNTLKLFGMAKSFETRLSQPTHAGLSHAEFTGLLVQDEKLDRDNRRLRRLLKGAKLRLQASLEDLNLRQPRGLSRQVLVELATPAWITARRNVLVTGPTGVGKTFVSCALGHAAARAGFTVRYVRVPRLFGMLQVARAKGDHLKTIEALGKVQLLILDDLLISPLADHEQRDLLEIIEDRYASASTVITSQVPLSDWHSRLGDPTIADAICDRLFHNAYKLALRGESVRKDGAADSPDDNDAA